MMQQAEGSTLLLKFTAQMRLSGRRAALAYRDTLSSQQLEVFYNALSKPWIPAAMGEPRACHWAISYFAGNNEGVSVMLWDLALIAWAHGCTVRAEYDEHSHTGHLTFGNTTAPVRAVLLAWMRGYVHAIFDEVRPGQVPGATALSHA